MDCGNSSYGTEKTPEKVVNLPWMIQLESYSRFLTSWSLFLQ